MLLFTVSAAPQSPRFSTHSFESIEQNLPDRVGIGILDKLGLEHVQEVLDHGLAFGAVLEHLHEDGWSVCCGQDPEIDELAEPHKKVFLCFGLIIAVSRLFD